MAPDPITMFFANVPNGTRALAERTWAWAQETAYGLQPQMKWGVPVLHGNAPVLYVACYRSHVGLGFHQGALLRDPHGILEGTGKGLRHVKIRAEADLADARLRALLEEAVAHDARQPDRRVAAGGSASKKTRAQKAKTPASTIAAKAAKRTRPVTRRRL